MSSPRPRPGQLLRSETNRLVEEIRRQLDGAAREQARELLLKALAHKREVPVVVETEGRPSNGQRASAPPGP